MVLLRAMDEQERQRVFAIAGPSGSGKDSIIQELAKRYSKVEIAVKFITRPMRPGEIEGESYYFITNEEFKEKLAAGEIPEYYYRDKTDTYYGCNKADIDERLSRGKIVAAQLQIIGAKYLKEHYNATTIFIMPTLTSDFEARIRARSPMTDEEWKEREEFTKREIESEAPWYDYRIVNEDGMLDETVTKVAEILQKEGFVLE